MRNLTMPVFLEAIEHTENPYNAVREVAKGF